MTREQKKLFYKILEELEPLTPTERHARINALEDPAVAELLRFAFDEPPSFRDLKRGDLIGKCMLIERLGIGGCGEVWLADQPLNQGKTSRKVALKLIRSNHLLGEDAALYLERFDEEIDILKSLGGPGIAHLYDADTAPLPGFDREVPYFVMEYVPGKPITEALRPRDFRAQVACFQMVCEAVQRAHNLREGVLHRDLKPGNILVVEQGGELLPTVLDFGLAQFFDPVRPLDMQTFWQGTPAYLAPEQIDPKLGGPSPRTDVHALGVILFQILTGALPHFVPDGRRAQYLHAICHGPRRTLRDMFRHPPPGLTRASLKDLDALVSRAMAVDSKARFSKPIELARALTAWLDGSKPHERQRGTRTGKPARSVHIAADKVSYIEKMTAKTVHF